MKGLWGIYWNLGNKDANVDGVNGPFFGYINSTTKIRLLRINTNDKGYCEAKLKAYRKLIRGDSNLDTVSLLGSQSMVMYADIKTIGQSSSNQERLFNIHFILSSAGQDYAPIWVNSSGVPKDPSATLSLTDYHLTCVNTKNKSEFCSFGEFNSIIYMRGQ
jgi:hypothetical protein